jgi:hypothetical protein
MAAEAAQDEADLSALHYATTLFERNVWLLSLLALWLREDRQIDAPSRVSRMHRAFTA